MLTEAAIIAIAKAFEAGFNYAAEHERGMTPEQRQQQHDGAAHHEVRAGDGRGRSGETVGFFRSGGGTGASQLTLGYLYPLSRRTAVQLYASRIRNERAAVYDFDRALAAKVVERIQGQPARVEAVEEQARKQAALLLHDVRQVDLGPCRCWCRRQSMRNQSLRH